MIRLWLSNGKTVIYAGDRPNSLEFEVRDGAMLPCKTDEIQEADQRKLRVSGRHVVAILRPPR